jgi:hypothetical protein
MIQLNKRIDFKEIIKMKKFGIMTALVLALSIAGSAFASTGTSPKTVSASAKLSKSAKSTKPAKKRRHHKAKKATKTMTATPPSK